MYDLDQLRRNVRVMDLLTRSYEAHSRGDRAVFESAFGEAIEIMPRAIDNATRDAMASYGPDLWTEQGEWSAFGNKIASYLPAEIAKLDGSGSLQYFCGPGSTETRCAPFTFIVSSVRPVDTSIISAYNQQVTATYQQQAAAARLKAAEGVYGSDANYFLGMEDLVNTCQASHVECNIYVGNPPTHP